MTIKRAYYPYISVPLSTAAAILIGWYISPAIGKTTVFLLFVLLITLNTWFAGFKAGIAATITLLSTCLFFFVFSVDSHARIVGILETGMLGIVGVFISGILEKYRKTEILNEFERIREDYQKKFQQVLAEREHMQKEIKLRDEFLSIASHELKTPLTTMLLKIQTVLHNIRNVSLANFSVANLLKMLETAELQTQRLSRLINDLLNVSLISTGKLNLERSKEDLRLIVQEVVDEFSEKLEKSNVHLTLDLAEKVEAHVDKLRIEQMMTNLVTNAIKYGNGKPIEIKVSNGAHKAKIIVKDHGIGINSDRKDHIFGLFERGVTDSSIKGLGVGLYIANQIVKAHGGQIRVHSKPNAGSTFTVEIPVE